MEWGDKVEQLELIRERGIAVKALDNAPAYRPDLVLYARAYVDCSTDRNHNGYLRFSAVARWCELNGADFSECWQVLRIADNGVKEWQHSRSNR